MANKKSLLSQCKENGDAILSEAAVNALSEILKLAQSDSTDSKTKYDIYKWLCEMHFGKPSTSAVRSDNSEKTLLLSFTGELDKWSK